MDKIRVIHDPVGARSLTGTGSLNARTRKPWAFSS